MNRFAFLVVFSVLAFSCENTDLNSPCTLVRGNPDGGRAIPLAKDDPVIKNSANKDFISFGSIECEDQVCVRDATFSGQLPDGGNVGSDGGTDNSPFAKGYCSRSCVAGSSLGCPSYSGQLDSNFSTKLTCRALILDEATLAAIKAADPARYQQTFGMTTSPFFCARGGLLPDGGMRQ